MMAIIYLLGVITATYLIGKAIDRHPDNSIECSGFIVGYCFALFSWFTVIMLILLLIDQAVSRKIAVR